MCGITGYFAIRGQLPQGDHIVRQMTDQLRHRGPDSAGIFAGDRCALGCRRLAIVDVVGGHQPVYNEDRTLVMVCNGEIFNAPELRAMLTSRGHRLRSQVDIEVLVHLYEERGVRMVDDLNGQFAFAIHDIARGTLFAARDHFGVCPFFYACAGDVLVFGSEIKALLQHPLVPCEPDLVGLDQVLSLPGLVSPRTMFRGIDSLPSGHSLMVHNGVLTTGEYWDVDFPLCDEEPAPIAEETYREALEDLLFKSVRRRLQADVPVGLYLSGGLDSSLVGAFISRALPDTRSHAFAISFQDALISESRFQRLAADYLCLELHDITFGPDDIADRMTRAIYHSEMPLKETYNTCSLALSEAARGHGVKVILAGEGADELLAGYVGYRFDQHGERGHRRDALEEALERDLRLRLWGDPELFYETDQRRVDEARAALYTPARLDGPDAVDCTVFPLVNHDRLKGRHPLHQRSYLDLKLRLCDHLVADHGDRMAMANSVEVRFPFLDVDLVQYLATVPPAMKLNGGRDKYLLRRVGRDWLPPAIVEREKFGFHAPGSPYLLQQGISWVQDQLSFDRIHRQGYFNPHAVERLKQQYSRPGFRLNLPFEPDLLIVVITFGLWLDLFNVARPVAHSHAYA